MDASLTDLQLSYTSEQLLEDDAFREPLIAGDVLCHGGFGANGSYCSPRQRNRAPAIRAWQERLARAGAELVDVPRALMPPQYPNAAQAKLLLREGVRDPIVRALTIVSIVEGFGAIIRNVEVPELDALVVEPLEGTALAHLGGGLFEAHARDEAGHRDQGGHKQMWEAARDLALENPKVPGDVLMRMMGRRGESRAREARFPQIAPELERLLSTMVSVLAIEVFAEGTFEWGKQVLGDAELSAEPERAAAMVGYIQLDEKPHVEYLRTALSELRVRTLRTQQGGTLSGSSVVDGLLHAALVQLTRQRPREQRDDMRARLAESVSHVSDPSGLLERFEALETRWDPPAATGYEPAEAAAAS